jgi:predicted GTPase
MGAIKTAETIWDALQAIGGGLQAAKLHELQEKQAAGDLFIAFCGHFSAGKSTLVNRLCGHRLLPSGPIPTSANVVRIRNGESSARIFRRSEDKGIYMERIPLERLEAACKDGESIETVEIRYPVPMLGKHVVLLDTPGIDSTDEAHQAATQSAMHLADIVFYVMDYNYVQSEINFAFAKKLQEAGKPLYLIVNQIDKHREAELPFEVYQEGVIEAFRNWHIEPAGILFLSLKDSLLKHNDWLKLPSLIRHFLEHSEPIKAWNMGQTARQLVREAFRDWKNGRELEKTLYLEACGGAAGLEETLLEERRLTEEEAILRSQSERSLNRWKKELQSIMDNANLTPASTRDLAASYLETRKPGFKTGFFSRAAKSEEERARRLKAFGGVLEEEAKAHLYWHAADYIKREAVDAGIRDKEFQESLDGMTADVKDGWLAAQVHAGPDFTGEYVLNYCRQISSELKQRCRQECWSLLERLASLISAKNVLELKKLAERKQELSLRLAAVKGLERMDSEELEIEESLLQLSEPYFESAATSLMQLPDPKYLEPDAAAAVPDQGASAVQTSQVFSPGTVSGQTGAGNAGLTRQPAMEQSGKSMMHTGQLKQAAARLLEGAALLEGLDGTAGLVRSIRERAAKLSDNRFTLALFGAFSAGKSSFANALMGERILPASPNPTTAAINTILPPDERYPHGTVRVFLKSREDMQNEMVYSLRAIGLDVTKAEQEDAERLLERIRKLVPADVAPSGKPHMAFLKAVEKGWRSMESDLGQVILVHSEQFHSYVADETRSCFASLVELYQETPLSGHGVVLVDTPGADSINARHTGVAFNYIKNADAILFVTYYNHAFSQADREFLMQLGRVKDTMQLDKMFFIVNAADLAAGPEELAGVLRHVEENLLRFGIRNPRLFPVSSVLAVEAKQAGSEDLLAASGISAFEESFRSFAERELAGMAIQNAGQELRQAAALLDRWISAAKQDEGERANKRAALAEACRLAQAVSRYGWETGDQSELRKELDEQLYYVKQRTSFRYSEMYRMAFNPAALREDSEDLRRAFKAAWQDLLRLLGVHLSQEVLAVTLRIEQFLNRYLKGMHERMDKELQQLLEGYTAPFFESIAFQTPAVDEAPKQSDPDIKWLLGFYRSGRQFFEGGGSIKLQEALQEQMSAMVNTYIGEHAERLYREYDRQTGEAVSRLSRASEEAVRNHAGGLESALSAGVDPGIYLSKKRILEGLLHNNG